jgi:hypothetical protein
MHAAASASPVVITVAENNRNVLKTTVYLIEAAFPDGLFAQEG